MEKISWTDRVKNKVFNRLKEARDNLRTVKKKEGQLDWSHVRRNCLLKHVSDGEIEGKNEVRGRRVERRKQLPDKKRLGYWKLKEEALDRTL